MHHLRNFVVMKLVFRFPPELPSLLLDFILQLRFFLLSWILLYVLHLTLFGLLVKCSGSKAQKAHPFLFLSIILSGFKDRI